MRYILGFDGGGTKTECVLMNSADQVLARTYGGASNPSRIGVESAVRAIEEAAELALRDAGLERSAITAVGAGLAGTAKPEMKERMSGALQKCFPCAAITVLTDLEAALAAAGEGPAVVLVVGTGSAAFGRTQMAKLRALEGMALRRAIKAVRTTSAGVLLLLRCTSAPAERNPRWARRFWGNFDARNGQRWRIGHKLCLTRFSRPFSQ